MSASLRLVQQRDMSTAPVQEKVYNLDEIDMNLEFLSNLLKYARFGDRVDCLEKADQWLDRRIRLTKLEKSVAS